MITTNDPNSYNLIYDYSYRVIGPIVYEYVSWVLHEALKRGYRKLYFLARDGYILCKAAKKICSNLHIDMECRYLYCSRAALRMPSYHLIGEEAFDLLLQEGYSTTAKTILKRADFDESQIEEFLDSIGVDNGDECLNGVTFRQFTDILRDNDLFKKIVLEKSLVAYQTAIDYFKQEKLFESDYIAIVDSGWVGSMQRSLRQLVRSVGYTGKLCGFYFGVYSNAKSVDDGEYLTFYFDKTHNIKNKVMFNNNLFECMLSAPHGMVKGYRYTDSTVDPVFADSYDEDDIRLINKQIDGAMAYFDMQLINSANYNKKRSIAKCYKILKQVMVYPTVDEANLYKSFWFSDDITEENKKPIVSFADTDKLNGYVFVLRIIKKVFGSPNIANADLFWVHGSMATVSGLKKIWYKSNVLLWDFMKYFHAMIK